MYGIRITATLTNGPATRSELRVVPQVKLTTASFPAFNGAATSPSGSSPDVSQGTTAHPTFVVALEACTEYDVRLRGWHPGGMQATANHVDVRVATTNAQGNTCAAFDTTLSNLTATSATSAGGTYTALALRPDFAPTTTTYTAAVPMDTSHVKLTPTVNNTGATVTVNGNTVTSGMPSAAIELNDGANVIPVLVTASNGSPMQTYTVNVHRRSGTLTLSVPNNRVTEGGTLTITGTLSSPVTALTHYSLNNPSPSDVRMEPSGYRETVTWTHRDGRTRSGTNTHGSTIGPDRNPSTFTIKVHAFDDDLPEQLEKTLTVMVEVDMDRDGSYWLSDSIDIVVVDNDAGNNRIVMTSSSPTLIEGGEAVTVTLSVQSGHGSDHGWLVRVTPSGTAKIRTFLQRDLGRFNADWDYHSLGALGTVHVLEDGQGKDLAEAWFDFDGQEHTLRLYAREDNIADDGETITLNAVDPNHPGLTGTLTLTIRDAGAVAGTRESGTSQTGRPTLSRGQEPPPGPQVPESDIFAPVDLTDVPDQGADPPPGSGQPVEDLFEDLVLTPPAPYDELISEMYGWRNDPQYVRHKSHTDRLDRVLLAFGERVADATLTPMPPAQAQKWADEGWGDAWTRMAAALGAIVTGTSGPDTLTGTGDGELLVGLGGADTLSGQGGNDELRGGDGDDDLTGGAGADRFVFLARETGAKAITDFASGDVIVLKGGGWSSAADIVATVQAVGSANYRYTLASGLTVETTNNRPLRTENFLVE